MCPASVTLSVLFCSGEACLVKSPKVFPVPLWKLMILLRLIKKIKILLKELDPNILQMFCNPVAALCPSGSCEIQLWRTEAACEDGAGAQLDEHSELAFTAPLQGTGGYHLFFSPQSPEPVLQQRPEMQQGTNTFSPTPAVGLSAGR